MPKTGAVAVMKAGEKARRAQQRVTEAEKGLAKALKGRAKADAAYFELLRESLPQRLQEPPSAVQEVSDLTTTA